MSKLHEVKELGQSVWLDFISRELIDSGGLDMRIEQGLMGMTSNPKIFDQAISEGEAYDAQLSDLARQNLEPLKMYEAIAIRDIQNAADKLRPIYDDTDHQDGFVSLEVNPHLAYEMNETIAEARHLYETVDRPNVMIKVPATNHGLVAIRRLISLGININVTLMFSLAHYNAVADAYIDGLHALLDNGGDVSQVASVASFFLSRIDVKVDPLLEEAGADHLKGYTAINTAKQVYRRFGEIFNGQRWEKLAEAGARVQRPLWASTSTKDPDYPDTMYIDSLIGPDTVNTMPPETLNAFLDHGTVARTVDKDLNIADHQLAELVRHNINLLDIGETLQREGVDKFVQPFDSLLQTISQQAKVLQ